MTIKKFDIISIGMGPAGMAISGMGAVMGLKVGSFEKRALGGECMNIGCIPSKSLLAMGKARHTVSELSKYAMEPIEQLPKVVQPFNKIQSYLSDIQKSKMFKTFQKCEVHLKEGDAHFVSPKVIESNGEKYTAKRIFVSTGTKPFIPPIPGIHDLDNKFDENNDPLMLTNENIFSLNKVPEKMLIIGGGAIGVEMAQGFSRLGTKSTIVQMDPYLVPTGEPDGAEILEKQFKKEGIDFYNSQSIQKIELKKNENGKQNIIMHLPGGKTVEGDKLLVAAGRKIDTSNLKLENAGIEIGKKGNIIVDDYLETTAKGVYACGDVNGYAQLSHAAMHQGMLALINSMPPWPMKYFMRTKYKKYAIPWTVFSDPEISGVGMTPKVLNEKNIPFEVHQTTYKGYGGAYAQGYDQGFLKVYTSKLGKIYGAQIVGKNSGELINEYAMAIDNGLSMRHFLFTQHSFPTFGWLNKRIGEIWMENKMNQNPILKKMCKLIYKLKM